MQVWCVTLASFSDQNFLQSLFLVVNSTCRTGNFDQTLIFLDGEVFPVSIGVKMGMFFICCLASQMILVGCNSILHGLTSSVPPRAPEFLDVEVQMVSSEGYKRDHYPL